MSIAVVKVVKAVKVVKVIKIIKVIKIATVHQGPDVTKVYASMFQQSRGANVADNRREGPQ